MNKFHFFQHHDPRYTNPKKIRTPWPWLETEMVLAQNRDGDLSAPWQAATSGTSVGGSRCSLSSTGKTMNAKSVVILCTDSCDH
jgi:hypothetical protein